MTSDPRLLKTPLPSAGKIVVPLLNKVELSTTYLSVCILALFFGAENDLFLYPLREVWEFTLNSMLRRDYCGFWVVEESS